MRETENQSPAPVRRRRRKPPRNPLLPLLCLGIAAVLILAVTRKGQDVPQETTAPTEETTIPPTTEPPLSAFFSADDWRLGLVNGDNPLTEEVVPELTTLSRGFQVDSRCYPDLQEMMDDCREAGLSPLICSAYRSLETQQELYQNKIDELENMGYSNPVEMAGTIVAVPGTSEHHLGLSLDIVDESYQLLDQAQEDTAVQQWLMEHSWEYGFILRYPNDKSDVTGIIYEPWHYRYVGRDAAKEIHDRGVCLEEFLELLRAE